MRQSKILNPKLYVLEHCHILVWIYSSEGCPVNLSLAVLSGYSNLCRARCSYHVEVGDDVSLFGDEGLGFKGQVLR
jgi:hypothetical protein